MTEQTVGRLAEVWVFPVKSMAGALLEEADVVAGGLAGDRSWAVVDGAGQPVTAAQEPRLRDVVPHLTGGQLSLDVPGAAPGLAPPEAAAALTAWLGRPLRLDHREGTGYVDVAPVHVVSRGSMADAEHAEQCDACDIRAPRANLVLDLDASADVSERDWLGRQVSLGGAVLRMTEHPNHCLGAYAEVAAPGRVHVGDEVLLG
jgi:uncharacterized protein YcbX